MKFGLITVAQLDLEKFKNMSLIKSAGWSIGRTNWADSISRSFLSDHKYRIFIVKQINVADQVDQVYQGSVENRAEIGLFLALSFYSCISNELRYICQFS